MNKSRRSTDRKKGNTGLGDVVFIALVVFCFSIAVGTAIYLNDIIIKM